MLRKCSSVPACLPLSHVFAGAPTHPPAPSPHHKSPATQLESREVMTNVLAAYVAGGKCGEVPAIMDAMKVSPDDSYELAYNAACALIGSGRLEEAEEQLQLARRLGERAWACVHVHGAERGGGGSVLPV
jgi:hypothetical protein